MECAVLGVLVLGFALAGCAEDGTAGRAAVRPVAVLGTPVLVAVKVPVCAATIAVAAPLAALSELAQPSPTQILFAEGRNCGPPYVVTP
jgi:hypothetical protein